MNDITWIQPYYHILLGYIPQKSKSVLDVGAGYGIFGFIIKKTRDVTLDCIEPFYTDLPHYNKVYRGTWNEVKLDRKYDVIVATEVIEHMNKDDALRFLDDVKIYGNRVIIATPKEFETQTMYDSNPYQAHKSVITKSEFEDHGYNVVELDRNLIGVCGN